MSLTDALMLQSMTLTVAADSVDAMGVSVNALTVAVRWQFRSIATSMKMWIESALLEVFCPIAVRSRLGYSETRGDGDHSVCRVPIRKAPVSDMTVAVELEGQFIALSQSRVRFAIPSLRL